MRIKFRKRSFKAALLLIAIPTLLAQNTNLSTYQGPGILSTGVGNIGTKSGEQVDLRYYLGVSGVVDSAFAAYATDSHGNLLQLPYLYGIEVDGGVYGVHSWKRSQLGLNYAGTYTKFFNYGSYNSNNHALSLGYTHQTSRHLTFDLRESAGSVTYGTGQVADAASTDLNSSFTPATRIFDTRTYYLQSTASATWLQSSRMSYSVGGTAFVQNLKSEGLSNGWGYSFNGSALRRMSKNSSLGASYVRSHFEYPGFSSRSDSNAYQGRFTTLFARFWTFRLDAGATMTQGESQFSFALNPVLAALFGQSTIVGISSYRTTYPSGEVLLTRHFRHAAVELDYFRGVNSGNGAYSTARLDSAKISFSYTGFRKINVGLDAGYYKQKSLGQNLGAYAQYGAGGGINYSLGHDLHLSARYDLRDQQVDLSNYNHRGSRATLGLNFSPGNLPLSLW